MINVQHRSGRILPGVIYNITAEYKQKKEGILKLGLPPIYHINQDYQSLEGQHADRTDTVQISHK